MIPRVLKPTAALFLLLVAGVQTTMSAQQPPRIGESVSLVEATILELQAAMSEGRLTAVQLVDAYLARIEVYDRAGPQLNAITRINPLARAEAAALDQERAERGPRSPLHGIPVIIKDNYDVAGLPTSGGSMALAGLFPPDDAFQVRKLREAGAIILAKSNLHELAAGITTISSFGGQTRNPYDLSRYPGGSSGGTGAAVAASLATVGWGSDTCGSIRIPASQNSLVGLRPTKGLSSVDGILPLSHTQDVGGPLARTATDLAIALDATVGPDPADPATGNFPVVRPGSFVDALHPDALNGARLGLLTQAFGDIPEEQEMSRIVREAVESMEAQGAEALDIEVEGLEDLLESSVIHHEFKFDLMDYLENTPGAPVASLRDILDLGLHHQELDERFRRRDAPESRDTEEYREALHKQQLLREALVRVMDEHELDALVYPAMKREAARIGDPQRGSNCQISAHSGLPSITVPAGFTENGLPAGVELLGRPLDDTRLLGLAWGYEQATDHRRPPGTAPELLGDRPPPPVTITVRAGGAEGTSGPRTTSASATFTFDPTRSELAYRVSVEGVNPADIHGVCLQRGNEDDRGPILHRLSGPGVSSVESTIALTPPQRDDLESGRMYLTVFTREHPTGAARGLLDLHAPPPPTRFDP